MPTYNKILFLDVDGVLNHVGTLDRTPQGVYGIDPENLDVFRKLAAAVDFQIVLSSTWRKYAEMVTYLKDKMPDLAPRIVDSTASLWQTRGHEIAKWLTENPTTAFAIVDDDSDMDHLADRLVRTDARFGLTPADADAITLLLNTPVSSTQPDTKGNP